MKHTTKHNKKRILRYRVRLFGKRADITTLLRNTLAPVLSDYSDVQNAIASGVDPKIAYNLPQPKLSALRRYERARAMYDEYQQNHGTPRADRLCSIVQPTTPNHFVHLIFQSTSNKNQLAYTHYRVVVAQQNNKSYNISCDCPDFMNRGGTVPCKHVLFVCMLLRDKAVIERR